MPLPQPLTPRPRMTLSRTTVGAGVGLLAVMLTASTLAAKQGAVLTKDNRDYFGDITADPADGPVTIVVTLPGSPGSPPRPPQPIQIKRANIPERTYSRPPRGVRYPRPARQARGGARGDGAWPWAEEPEWASSRWRLPKRSSPTTRACSNWIAS